MQETVTSPTEKRSLLSSFLELLEARERQARDDRQLQEEKYLRRTQKIYDFHERQRRSALEVRRCLEYVSSHAHVLESVVRGAGAGAADAPLSAALARQAAALQRRMVQCVANAVRIRTLLAATHQPQMDAMLAKMEAELSTWTAFLHRAVDATHNTEGVMDNLQNFIAEQRRCVREVSSSAVLAALCAAAEAEAEAEAGAEAGAGVEAGARAASPLERRAPSKVCSTPIARD